MISKLNSKMLQNLKLSECGHGAGADISKHVRNNSQNSGTLKISAIASCQEHG